MYVKKFSSFSRILKEDAHKRNCLTVYLLAGATLSEMPTFVALPTSHHFHPSLSPVVSLTLGILHELMRTQMLAKPSSDLLHRELEATTGVAAHNDIHDDLSSLDLEILCEARALAQNRFL